MGDEITSYGTPRNTWHYITGGTGLPTLVDLRAFPTDYALKSILRDMAANKMTRLSITERYTAIVSDLFAKEREVNALIDHYGIGGTSRVYSYNCKAAIEKQDGYCLDGPMEVIYDRFYNNRKETGPIERGYIISSLRGFFRYSYPLKHRVETMQKNKIIKFDRHDTHYIDKYSSFVIERYKNENFKAPYTIDLHRAYLNILRFEKRVEDVVTALEVTDKLNGEFNESRF